MKNIKVLVTGCANCKTTLKLIEEAARAKSVVIEMEKVEEIQHIMSYGVMSTPGVVIDDQVVHAGSVPDKAKIEGWLSDTAEVGGCCGGAVPNGGGCC
jgi:small redox-active disulfide protein 2